MRYLKRISNYSERIPLCDLTHVMILVDHMTIGVKKEMQRIERGCYLEKEFTELICTNPWMVLYQTINQVDSCYGYVCGPLTWGTKDILQMNDSILTVAYESLAMRSPKCHRLDMSWSPQRWLSGQDRIIHLWFKRRSTKRMRCS